MFNIYLGFGEGRFGSAALLDGSLVLLVGVQDLQELFVNIRLRLKPILDFVHIIDCMIELYRLLIGLLGLLLRRGLTRKRGQGGYGRQGGGHHSALHESGGGSQGLGRQGHTDADNGWVHADVGTADGVHVVCAWQRGRCLLLWRWRR